MNERQCVPAPESLLIGCMQTYLWRDERSGRCYFRLETRQEMPMKEMIRDSYVKNNLDNKEIRWNVINCDATQAGISFFKERTPIKVYGYFSLDSMPDGVAYDFIVTRVEETDAEEMTILEYLITFPGINFSDAVVIVKNHGTDMFRMVHQPGIVNRLVAETRLPSNVISNLCKSIASTTEERKVFELLHDCGVSYAACAKAVKLYGSSVEEKIMEDPYSYGKKLGLGFLTCDKLGVKFHKPAEFFGRIKLAAFEAANILSANGHTYYTGELFHYNIQRILNSGCYAEHVPTSAVLTAIGKDYLQEVDGQNCIIHPQKYLTAEKRIAKNIRRLASASCENQSFSPDLILYAARACKMNYGEQQRSAFPMVLRKKGVKILTGGPGTGKTTTILGILLAYKRMHPKDTIRLCAPTGRAAQRMAESTHMEAVTVHRLLDLKPYGDTTVCKDSSDPIDADLIVVDVMFYKNNYSISSYEGEIGLYNGDIGKIVKVSESGLTVNVRNSHYEITRDLMDNLGLSYAMTIHKSQGSEFSCIIVVMPAEPTNMLVRNLFYTAVTRAKKKVYVIDESYAMETSIRIAKAGKRLTNLAEYLKSE